MAKAVYYPKGERQKTIIKLLNSLEGRYSRWDIWQDFIVLSAVSIANAFGGPYREQREAMYLERSKKYSTSELEVLAQMLAEVVDEMEQNPDQDLWSVSSAAMINQLSPESGFLPGAFPSRSESRASRMPWKNSKGKQITKLLSIPSSSCLPGLFGPA